MSDYPYDYIKENQRLEAANKELRSALNMAAETFEDLQISMKVYAKDGPDASLIERRCAMYLRIIEPELVSIRSALASGPGKQS